MNCLDFRRAALADPRLARTEPALAEHAAACDVCRRFAGELAALDAEIERALDVPVPEGLAARIMLRTSGRRRQRWVPVSAAAAAALTAVTVLTIAVFVREPAFAETLVDHIENEVHQVHGKSGTIDDSRLAYTVAQSGARLLHADAALPRVVYASNCVIDGQLAAHFVIETAEGQYTVMLLPDATGPASRFASGRWHGVLTQHGHGQVAVITDARAHAGTMHAIAADFRARIVFEGV